MQIKKKKLISASMVWSSQGKDEKNKDELQIFLKSLGLKTPQKYFSFRFILVKSPSIQKLARHFLNELSGFPVYLRKFFLVDENFLFKRNENKSTFTSRACFRIPGRQSSRMTSRSGVSSAASRASTSASSATSRSSKPHWK